MSRQNEHSYFKCRWLHNDPSEPIYLFQALTKDRIETRKVYLWADGKIGYAGPGESVNDVWLAETQIPTLSEISADPQFEPVEIDKVEFEEIWESRKK